MCGCWSRAAVPISRRKRSAPRLAEISGRRIFTATGRSCLRSCARKTSAAPPRPTSRSSRYRAPNARRSASSCTVSGGSPSVMKSESSGAHVRRRAAVGAGDDSSRTLRDSAVGSNARARASWRSASAAVCSAHGLVDLSTHGRRWATRRHRSRVPEPPLPCPRCHAATPPSGRFCAACGASLPAESAAARSSRRQMTVLFCDLVGSTDLAQRIDPDDLLVALESYHELVREISARFGGFIARIVGDGIDVYFGYPVANEDDAARALHTALALAAEVPRIEAAPGEPLALRIGIATGTVAVSVSQGVALAGLTPNLASRIQAAVPPGAIGVAPSTRRIAGRQFQFDEMGEHTLKGFEAPVSIGVLRGALSLDSRSASRGRDTSLPIVGRDAELATLLAHWQRASAGRTCGALLVGEPGIGKSRLVSALDSALPAQGHTLLRLQCSPFHVNSALQPFVLHLAAAAGFARRDTATEQLDKLEAQLAIAGIEDTSEHALIAALLGVPADDRYPPLAMPAPMQLHLTRETLKRYFTGLARHQARPRTERTSMSFRSGQSDVRSLLVVIEDMHWIDPTSLELVDQLLAAGDDAPMLLVMTTRSEFQSPWRDGDDFVQLVLQRLTDADAKAIASQQSNRDDLPADWLATIIERTDGVPLFIEEMTRMLLDRRAAQSGGDVV